MEDLKTIPRLLKRIAEACVEQKSRVERADKRFGGYRVKGLMIADMKRARAYSGGYNQALLDIKAFCLLQAELVEKL